MARRVWQTLLERVGRFVRRETSLSMGLDQRRLVKTTMSARIPYYVKFRRIGPTETFETDAAHAREALDDFWSKHKPDEVHIDEVAPFEPSFEDKPL